MELPMTSWPSNSYCSYHYWWCYKEDEAWALPMIIVNPSLLAKEILLTVKIYGGVPFFGVTEISVHCKEWMVIREKWKWGYLINPTILWQRPVCDHGINVKRAERKCNICTWRLVRRGRDDCVGCLTSACVSVLIKLGRKLSNSCVMMEQTNI